MREIRTAQYDNRGYTNEHSLAKLMLSKPDVLTSKLTYMWGKELSNDFSFLMMTEGQNNIKYVNDVQFTWPTMGKLSFTDEVVAYDATVNATPGINNTIFYVTFKTDRIIPQYGLLAKDGITQARVLSYEKATVGYRYALTLKNTDPTAFCDIANLQPGAFWVMLPAKVSESGSRGNKSNIMGKGEMTNQTSFVRYTQKIQGNIANKVVEVEFEGSETKDGKPTSLWMAEQQRQFEVMMRKMNNHDLYTSEYNRNALGEIIQKDDETGEPIPEGAGIRQSIMEVGNYDTYGYTLTTSKLKNTVADVFWGAPDGGKMEIVIHGGQGFGEDFHEAIMSDATSNGFMTAVGEQFIKNGTDGHLSYGNTFTQYRTVTGHTITFKHDTMFDDGLLGELDTQNGNLHPRTGYPMSSHTGVFMDYSTYGGERNVQLVSMKGQTDIIGILKGMAPIPAMWGVLGDSKAIATDKDESVLEYKQSKSINIKVANRCFILKASN